MCTIMLMIMVKLKPKKKISLRSLNNSNIEPQVVFKTNKSFVINFFQNVLTCNYHSNATILTIDLIKKSDIEMIYTKNAICDTYTLFVLGLQTLYLIDNSIVISNNLINASHLYTHQRTFFGNEKVAFLSFNDTALFIKSSLNFKNNFNNLGVRATSVNTNSEIYKALALNRNLLTISTRSGTEWLNILINTIDQLSITHSRTKY